MLFSVTICIPPTSVITLLSDLIIYFALKRIHHSNVKYKTLNTFSIIFYKIFVVIVNFTSDANKQQRKKRVKFVGLIKYLVSISQVLILKYFNH